MTYTAKKFGKDMWIFLEGYRIKFSVFTAIRYLSGLFPFLSAYLLGILINFFTDYNKNDSLSFAYLLIIGIVISTTLSHITRFYSKFNLQKIGAYLRRDLRVKAIKQLMILDLEWHEDQDAGSKIQKISQGGDKVVEILNKFSNDWIEIIIGISASFIIFLIMDLKYLIYIVILFFLYIITYKMFFKKMVELNYKVLKTGEIVSGKIHESTSNIVSIKSLGLQKKINHNTQKYEKMFFNKWLNSKKFNITRNVILLTLLSLAYGGFLFLITRDFVLGNISIGFIVIYLTYFDRFRGSLHKLIWEISGFAEVIAAVDRFMGILGADKYRKSEKGKKVPKNWSNITFKNVNFNYKEKNVLDNFNLNIEKNKKIAIVGKSGSGKSTITKLLLSLYEPKTGKICIDNINLNKIKQSSLNNFFSVVLQDSEVFNTTIYENITFGKISEDKNKLEKVIKISQLDQIIKKLPNELNTKIGEKGYKLSGGERQRLGIARALFASSEILIMDEATSSLDSKTEKKIIEAINKSKLFKTQIIISHRLSTIKECDLIYVIDKGKIIEKGNYEKLLKQKKLFYNLKNIQK